MPKSTCHDRSGDAICGGSEKNTAMESLGTLSETNIKPLARDTPSTQDTQDSSNRTSLNMSLEYKIIKYAKKLIHHKQEPSDTPNTAGLYPKDHG